MNALKARLSRLEAKSGLLASLSAVVFAGSSEVEIERLLRSAGIDRSNPAHDVTIFQTIYEAPDGSVGPEQPVGHFTYVA